MGQRRRGAGAGGAPNNTSAWRGRAVAFSRRPADTREEDGVRSRAVIKHGRRLLSASAPPCLSPRRRPIYGPAVSIRLLSIPTFKDAPPSRPARPVSAATQQSLALFVPGVEAFLK